MTSASVPLATPTACVEVAPRASACSASATRGPRMKRPESTTSAMAASSRSRIAAYCVLVSISGTCTYLLLERWGGLDRSRPPPRGCYGSSTGGTRPPRGFQLVRLLLRRDRVCETFPIGPGSPGPPEEYQNVNEESFRAAGVSERVDAVLRQRGFTAPFKIQSLVLADALAGRYVLAKSPTGSGKTLAFSIPIAER